MDDSSFTLLYKLRFVLGSMLVLVGLLLLSVILSVTTANYKVHADNANSNASYSSANADDPNVVADFMSTMGDSSIKTINSLQQTLNSSLHTVTTSIASAPVSGSKAVAKGAYSGVAFIGGSVSGAASFIAHVPGRVIKLTSPSSIVSSTIKPADDMKVPTINSPKSSTVSTVNAPAAAPTAPSIAGDSEAQWPLHGTITTLFGVPELPYEAVHTGMDISDGQHSPIRPFKPGKVVQVIHGYTGLGNHVVVDHGAGITSIYGHLYSISVQVGQTVDKNSVIGYEGATGMATGIHLHFEIRLNGQPVNPQNYIPGRP